MTRNELAALRDAIDTVLTWPPAVLAEVARWLTPAAPQPGNGLDPHPPPIESIGRERRHPIGGGALEDAGGQSAPRQAEPGEGGRAAASDGDAGEPRSIRERAGQRRGEQQERDRRTPAKARLARTCREGQRRSLAAKGGGDGVGPYAGAPVDLTAAPEADRSDAPPLAAPSRWVRALACYERKEPHEFQMSRYG